MAVRGDRAQERPRHAAGWLLALAVVPLLALAGAIAWVALSTAPVVIGQYAVYGPRAPDDLVVVNLASGGVVSRVVFRSRTSPNSVQMRAFLPGGGRSTAVTSGRVVAIAANPSSPLIFAASSFTGQTMRLRTGRLFWEGVGFRVIGP